MDILEEQRQRLRQTVRHTFGSAPSHRRKRRLKRPAYRPATPTPRPLTETETDASVRSRTRLGPFLAHAERHRVLAEAVESTAAPSATGALVTPTGWEACDGGCSHAQHGRIYFQGTEWRHHGPDHLIRRRGQGMQALAEYAKRLADPATNQIAAESSNGLVVAERILRGDRTAGLVLTEHQRATVGRVLDRGALPASVHDAVAKILRGGAR